MILNQINSPGIVLVPLKCNTPGSVYMYTVSLWFAFQPMEIEAGDIDFIQFLGFIEYHQPTSAPAHQIRTNAAGIIFYEQARKSFAAEAFDHKLTIAGRTTFVNFLRCAVLCYFF